MRVRHFSLKIKLSSVLFVLLISLIALPYPGLMGKGVLRLFDFYPGGVAFFSVLILICLDSKVSKSLPIFCVFIVVFWQAFVTLMSPISVDFFRDLSELYKFLVVALYGLAGLFISRYARPQVIQYWLVAVFIFVSLIATLQVLLGPSWVYYFYSGRSPELVNLHYSNRIVGTIGNPSHMAVLLIGYFYYFLYHYMLKSGRSFLFLAILSFVFLVLTQSRSNLVYLLVLAIPFLLILRQYELITVKTILMFSGVLALFFFLSAAYFSSLATADKLRYLISGFSTVREQGLLEQSSFAGRVEMWQYFIEYIIERPFLGYGPGRGFWRYDVADNNYIFTIAKYGLVGVILVLVVFFASIKNLYSNVPTVGPLAIFPLFLGLAILLNSLTSEMMESPRIVPIFFLLAFYVRGAEARNVE